MHACLLLNLTCQNCLKSSSLNKCVWSRVAVLSLTSGSSIYAKLWQKRKTDWFTVWVKIVPVRFVGKICVEYFAPNMLTKMYLLTVHLLVEWWVGVNKLNLSKISYKSIDWCVYTSHKRRSKIYFLRRGVKNSSCQTGRKGLSSNLWTEIIRSKN